MSVAVRDGKFVINGQDTFLFGGEVHYFRIPRSEWADRLAKLKAAGCNLVSTYVPWTWHEPREGEIDLTGQTHEQRDLAGFLELVKRSGMYCFVRPGPYVMAEIRYEGAPAWLIENYPEVIARRRDGSPHPAKVATYRHPVFLEKVRRWYEAVNRVIAPMQITRGGPIILYQLCNEIGMIHWVTQTLDFSPTVLQQFAAYLREKYGTIGAFREKYGVPDESFEAFAERFGRGLGPEDPSFHFEWGYFWRKYIKDYVGDLRQMARETGIEVPFIINVHGFSDFSIYSRGVHYPIGLSQLYRTVEYPDVYLAGDFYPGHVGYDSYHDLVLASEFTKAVSPPAQPLFSAEFQSGRAHDRPRVYPQDLDLNTRTCVAHGMNALNYYMFAGGVNPDDIGLLGQRHEWQAPIDSRGGLRPSYGAAQRLGRVFSVIGPALVNAPKKVHTFVGFLPDDYLTEVVEPRDRALLGERIALRDHIMFNGVARLLVCANIHFEAVDLLKRLDPHRVPTLWVYSSAYMDAGLQERLARYVQEGGRLVLYPQIPVKDQEGRPCTVLRDALGLGEWEVVRERDTVDVLDIPSVHVQWRLRFTAFDGEPVAVFTRKGGGEVAAYRKAVGRGDILVLGIALTHSFEYQVEVIRRLAALIGVRGHLHASAPDLSLVERTDGTQSFLFANNYDELEVRAVIYEDGKPLFDGAEVVLPPRSGVILARNFRVAPGVTVAYATAELTGLERSDGEIRIRVAPVGAFGHVKLDLGEGWRLEAPAAVPEPSGALRVAGETVLTVTRKS